MLKDRSTHPKNQNTGKLFQNSIDISGGNEWERNEHKGIHVTHQQVPFQLLLFSNTIAVV